MSLTEYDQELHMKTIREESIEEGMEMGRREGMEKGLVLGTIRIMRDMRMPTPAIKEKILDMYHLSEEDAEDYLQLVNG